MRKAVVIEIGSGSAVDCSRRILNALRAGSAARLDRELLRARRVCAAASRAGTSGLEAEQADLLEGILEEVEHQPCGKMEISLLGHLAGAA
jgi:hypothetical protein